jgi:hypothetical protein
MVDLAALAFLISRTANQAKRASAPEERAKGRQTVEGIYVAQRAAGRETQRHSRQPSSGTGLQYSSNRPSTP